MLVNPALFHMKLQISENYRELKKQGGGGWVFLQSFAKKMIIHSLFRYTFWFMQKSIEPIQRIEHLNTYMKQTKLT